jgi:methylated-DNA-[protein]-cysteine S-methyltransferase
MKKKKRGNQTFSERVFNIVSKIPRGKTLTYSQVAGRAGNPRASRAVGSVLSTNYDPKIPCHRVIRSDGGMGGYNRGVRRKIALLRREKAI